MKEFARLLRSKRAFLVAVYASLIAQILITFAVMQSDWAKTVGSKHPILVFVLILATLLALVFIAMPTPLKFALLCVMSALLGAFLRRAADRAHPGTVKSALLGAAGVFVAMTIFGFALAASGVNLAPLGIWLFAALLGLIVAQVVMLFTKPQRESAKWLVRAVLILFSLYIVYDTNQVLSREYAGDWVQASLDFYLDFFNVFAALLGQN